MPRLAQLPEDLQPIVFRHAAQIRQDRFAADLEPIIRIISGVFEKAEERKEAAKWRKERADARETSYLQAKEYSDTLDYLDKRGIRH
jgi:hypothetical protein